MAKYRIKLVQGEVKELDSIIKKGSHSTQTYRAAYVLLNCDEGEYSLGKSTNAQIFEILKVIGISRKVVGMSRKVESNAYAHENVAGAPATAHDGVICGVREHNV